MLECEMCEDTGWCHCGADDAHHCMDCGKGQNMEPVVLIEKRSMVGKITMTREEIKK